MLGQRREVWPSASYQGLVNVVTKYETFVYFYSKDGKDMRFVSDVIDSSVNPRTQRNEVSVTTTKNKKKIDLIFEVSTAALLRFKFFWYEKEKKEPTDDTSIDVY